MNRISSVTDRVAYLVLMAACQNDARTRDQALAILDQFESSYDASETTPSEKRKADDDNLLVCRNCKEKFAEDKSEGSVVICRFHAGRLEPDHRDDFWADHDEDCHGTIDTVEMQVAFPEGFYWPCCEAANGAPGCETRSCHVPSVAVNGLP